MPGTIVFKPIEANIISKDKDVLGKMDPYLSFHLGGLKRVKGEVAKSGGQHPIWNDAITVEVSDQSSLTVDLKDKDMLIDDKIASFEVDLREVQSQGRVRKWYPIFRKSEPAGELLMEATFSGGMGGQFGTGLNQGQYAGVGGLSQGQYGTGLNQGQYSTGLSQGQGYSATGVTQGQGYSTTGLSQGQGYSTTGLSQGQYGTTTGLSQGQGYSATGVSQGQYGSTTGLNQGQYGTTTGLTQGQGYSASGSTGSSIYGQSGNVITTPGTVISQTSTSYPVQQGTQQYKSGGLQQGTQFTSGGLQQGTQYPSGGLQQGGTQYSAVPLGSLQQGQYGTSNLPQGQFGTGNLPQGQYGSLPQGQIGGLQSGGFPQGQGYGSQGSQISSEQFAKEALLRGSDPLNTRQNEVYNLGQAGYGGYGVPHQNLTQTPSFSGTDPLLYEGDKNRFSNPPQQVPYKGKTIEEYGHRHGKHGTTPTTDPYSGYSSTLAKEGQY